MKLSNIFLAVVLMSPISTFAAKGITQQFIYCPTVGTIRAQGGEGINGVQLILPDGRIERQIGVEAYVNDNGEKISRGVYHLGDVMYINSTTGSVAFQDSTGSWIHGCRFL